MVIRDFSTLRVKLGRAVGGYSTAGTLARSQDDLDARAHTEQSVS